MAVTTATSPDAGSTHLKRPEKAGGLGQGRPGAAVPELLPGAGQEAGSRATQASWSEAHLNHPTEPPDPRSVKRIMWPQNPRGQTWLPAASPSFNKLCGPGPEAKGAVSALRPARRGRQAGPGAGRGWGDAHRAAGLRAALVCVHVQRDSELRQMRDNPVSCGCPRA